MGNAFWSRTEGHGEPPSFVDNYLILLVLNTVFAGIGGYVTAVIARKAKIFHALALGSVFLLYAFYWVISFPSTKLFLLAGILQFIGAIARGCFRKWFNSPKLN